MKHTRRNQIKDPSPVVIVLKKLRTERGFSIRKAAEAMGKSPSWLNHLESGRFDPKDSDLELAARFFSIDRADLRDKAASLSPVDLLDKRTECIKIIKRLKPEMLDAIYTVIRHL